MLAAAGDAEAVGRLTRSGLLALHPEQRRDLAQASGERVDVALRRVDAERRARKVAATSRRAVQRLAAVVPGSNRHAGLVQEGVPASCGCTPSRLNHTTPVRVVRAHRADRTPRGTSGRLAPEAYRARRR